jgi:hypothetical protein
MHQASMEIGDAMSKALATTRYFLHPRYALAPLLVDHDITAAIGVRLGIYSSGGFASYENELGRALIEKALGKKFFTYMAALDPEVARYQLDKNLP